MYLPCFITYTPVSYTHLDVYKRQVLTPAEAKAAFLAALKVKAEAITAADVTVVGEDIGVVFASDADIGAVYGAAEALLAAFRSELQEAAITLKLNGEEETFYLDDADVATKIALYLLGDLTPAEFLAQRDAIEATYTATATDKYGVEFALAGSLKFQTVLTPAEAKAAFLAALETKAAAITAADVTVAVSYTHLDVYKRQRLRSTSWAAWLRKSFWPRGMRLWLLTLLQPRINMVSPLPWRVSSSSRRS